MTRIAADDLFVAIGFGVCVLLVVWILILGGVHGRTLAACLRAGYPSVRVDWTLHRYCIKRVDQTDVVVPLSQVVP